jgi:hypothetical protein
MLECLCDLHHKPDKNILSALGSQPSKIALSIPGGLSACRAPEGLHKSNHWELHVRVVLASEIAEVIRARVATRR